MSIVKRIKVLMDDKNIFVVRLSEKSGVHRNTINKMFKTGSAPKIELIIALKKIVPSVNLDWLILGKGKRYELNEDDLIKQEKNSDPKEAPLTFPEDSEFIYDDISAQKAIQELIVRMNILEIRLNERSIANKI